MNKFINITLDDGTPVILSVKLIENVFPAKKNDKFPNTNSIINLINDNGQYSVQESFDYIRIRLGC